MKILSGMLIVALGILFVSPIGADEMKFDLDGDGRNSPGEIVSFASPGEVKPQPTAFGAFKLTKPQKMSMGDSAQAASLMQEEAIQLQEQAQKSQEKAASAVQRMMQASGKPELPEASEQALSALIQAQRTQLAAAVAQAKVQESAMGKTKSKGRKMSQPRN